MMHSRPILTIAIPTFNRSKFLKYLLESIFRDFERLPDDLELLIFDNASTDDTEGVVAHFFSSNKQIYYTKNIENVGGDANVANCYLKANGKYVWVIGDDEILYSGCVGFVLDFCRHNKFGLLHMECATFVDGEQERVIVRQVSNNLMPRLLTSISFFNETNIALTFISANIVNKEILIEAQLDFEKEVFEIKGLHLPQLAFFYNALKNCGENYRIDSPMLAGTLHNSGGYEMIKVFGENLSRITKKIIGEWHPRSVQVIENASITLWMPYAVRDKILNISGTNKYKEEDIWIAAKMAFGHRLLFWLLLAPFFFTSNFMIKYLLFIIQKFNGVNRKLGYFFFKYF